MIKGIEGLMGEKKQENVDLVEESGNLDAEAMQSVAENKESPEDAFKRVSLGRINKVIKYLNLLGGMACQPNYKYSSEDIERMFDSMQDALDMSKQAYLSKKDAPEFEW